MKITKLTLILLSINIVLTNCRTAKNNAELPFVYRMIQKEGYKLSTYMSEKQASDKFNSEINDVYNFDVRFDCNSIADCDLLAANEAAIKAAQQIGIAVNSVGIAEADNRASTNEEGKRYARFTASISNTLVPNLRLNLKFVKDLKEGNKKYNIVYIYSVKKSEFKNAFYNNEQEFKKIKQNSKTIDEFYDNVSRNLEKLQPNN